MSYRMNRCRRVTACLALSLVTGLAAASDATNQNGVLRLRTGDVFTTPATNALARLAVPVDLTRRVAVIQLAGPITADQRRDLDRVGVVLHDYLPDFAYAADLSRADIDGLRNLAFVRWVGAFQNAWKISPDLGMQPLSSANRIALRDGGLHQVQIALWPATNLNQVLDGLRAIDGVQVVEHAWTGRETSVIANIPLERAAAIAAIAGVRWIEDTPELSLRNATVRWVVQSNVSGSFPIHDKGIRGEGQIVAIMDGKVGYNHCALNDPQGDPVGPNHRKVEAYNTSYGSDFHGTHVAGTVVGDNGLNDDNRGVAYMGRLVFNTYTFGGAFLTRLQQHYGQGAAVHTNSWGNDGTTAYDSLARTIDVFSYDNDDNLVCFAVTNQSSLRNPENAKNVLAVGASQDAGSANNFCSGGSGPTNDGRRKPEIYSPGCSIRSASAGSACSTTSLTGTSMACPSIAGSAMLVRQYFMDGFYPSGAANPGDAFTPSGALVKATLLNSTVDMTGVSGYPSNREGWGRVLLHNSLVFDDDARELIVHDVRNGADDAMTTNDAYEIEVEVHSLFEPLKITLVWHDAPGNLNANPAYVNDLNLTVTGPSGTYLGNVFTNGISATGGSADFRNNVEMVYLPAPVAGTYTVRVDANAVNVGEQGYALVISGDVSAASACVADWNGDGVLDFFDVADFLDDFSSQAAQADLTGDGVFDFFDVAAYLDAFSAGCP